MAWARSPRSSWQASPSPSRGLPATRARIPRDGSLRQRIAQDLHDEIGSSLGSIALIAQDIRVDDPQARDDLAEIKTIADETVSAMRDITRLIQSDRYGSDDLPLLLRDNAADDCCAVHPAHLDRSNSPSPPP
jgi:signal transduction histidine kinase